MLCQGGEFLQLQAGGVDLRPEIVLVGHSAEVDARDPFKHGFEDFHPAGRLFLDGLCEKHPSARVQQRTTMPQRLLGLGEEHEASREIHRVIRPALVIVDGFKTYLGKARQRGIPKPSPCARNVVGIDVDADDAQALPLTTSPFASRAPAVPMPTSSNVAPSGTRRSTSAYHREVSRRIRVS